MEKTKGSNKNSKPSEKFFWGLVYGFLNPITLPAFLALRAEARKHPEDYPRGKYFEAGFLSGASSQALIIASVAHLALN